MGVYPPPPQNNGASPSDKSPSASLTKPVLSSKSICMAFYDRKIFQLSNLTQMEPQSVLDIEFINYSEGDIEVGTRGNLRKQRGFTLKKLNRILTFVPISKA